MPQYRYDYPFSVTIDFSPPTDYNEIGAGPKTKEGSGTMTQNPTSPPADFEFCYEWASGTVPPPHHYEITIYAGPGPQGRMDFYPDYGDTPRWEETFSIQPEAWGELYALMEQRGVFSREWKQVTRRTEGGSLQWLRGVVEGRSFSIPSQPQQAERLEEVYASIRALVPERIWDEMRKKRMAYIEEHEQ